MPARRADRAQKRPARLLWAGCLLLMFGAWAGNEEIVRHPFAGVTHVAHAQKTPEPLSYHLVRIALDTPGLRFLVTPSNGDAPRDTRTQTTLDFVRQTRAQLGVNANYFTLDHEADTDLLGLAVSEGQVVSPWDESGAAYGVNIGKDNRVTFVERAAGEGVGTKPPVELYNAVSGRYRLIHGGQIEPETGGERHPRTGIGWTPANELLLLIVDGRAPSHSVGMTLRELADTLRAAGATEAVALDGGGSATLVLAEPEPKVVNVPLPNTPLPNLVASPPGIQRKNGNNIAVFAPPASKEGES